METVLLVQPVKVSLLMWLLVILSNSGQLFRYRACCRYRYTVHINPHQMQRDFLDRSGQMNGHAVYIYLMETSSIKTVMVLILHL